MSGGAPGTAGSAGTLLAPGSLPTGWILYSPPPAGLGRVSFSVTPVESGAAGGTAPEDLVQQVPVPASGRCVDVKDADLTWQTGLTGGWQLAWGDWAQRVVCSRTFHFGPNGWEILG